MNSTVRDRDGPGLRIALLAGQGFALGLTMAWILIPASTIFLETYGPERLPVTYIGAALAGVVSSTALAAALRRKPLALVATYVLAALVVFLVLAWLLLAQADATWVAFALLVLVPIVVPVGFVFVVGQAGMLLDVRVLKALYARVVAGFAFGFMVGGLAGPVLLGVLGGTAQLLAAAAAGAGLFLGLVVVARRRYPGELAVVESAGTQDPPPTLRTLTRHRYVMLIVGFQMLSAVESQWLDFLVFDRAAQRYTDSEDLARFVSQFSAIAYGTDILFLLALAGLLLRRFGLRYGLTANSVGVLTVVLAIVVTTALLGSAATMVFVLIVAARVTDLTFSDGTSRTSLSAAYQALPTRLRGVAQATVEGLAVPVAIGISGVVLLFLQSAGGTGGLVLPLLTAAVVVAWLVTATLLYREYRVNLLSNLRSRTLDPADLTVDDDTSLIVIDRLVQSSDERDVRLGLDILTIAQHPALPARLQHLVVDDRVRVRTDALERLVQLAPLMAAAAARDGLDDPFPEVRAASIRVLGAVRDPADRARIAACATDPEPDVTVAVVFALTRIGDGDAPASVATDIATLTRSSAPSDRALAARMIGACGPGRRPDSATLKLLVTDRDPDVANAALGAVHWVEDDDLLSDVVARLGNRRTAPAAADALVRAGEPVLLTVDDGLGEGAVTGHAQVMLVRIARDVGGRNAAITLRRYVAHPDREVGLAVMTALAMLGPEFAGSDDDLEQIESLAVRGELEHATRVLRARMALDGIRGAAVTCAALDDELDLAQRRALAALSMRHGVDALQRIAFQLSQRETQAHALALEWLDVTLRGSDRAVVALLEPGLTNEERFIELTRHFPSAAMSREAALLDLVHDPDGRWHRPWLRACALYTASLTPDIDFAPILAAAGDTTRFGGADEDDIAAETLAFVRGRYGSPTDTRS